VVIKTGVIYCFSYICYKVIDMTNIQLYAQISSLPSDLKKEVSDFVDFLKQKSKKGKKIKERQFGYSKGFFTMSDDFDEPLEDFKEYM
jgi:hypothetical protein